MARFRYYATDGRPNSLMPRLPMSLCRGGRSVDIVGLLDSGAAVSVLPFQIGLAIGAVWDEQRTILPLAGNLAPQEARALIVSAQNPEITAGQPVNLAFARTRSNAVPVIFGQMNFFLEFDVCFYRSLSEFDVQVNNRRASFG